MHPDLQLRRAVSVDTFDLKPDAPPRCRGEFRPIATCVPGITIYEHLPRLARVANLYTIVRSVNHIDNDHAVGTYLVLTGMDIRAARPLWRRAAGQPAGHAVARLGH